MLPVDVPVRFRRGLRLHDGLLPLHLQHEEGNQRWHGLLLGIYHHLLVSKYRRVIEVYLWFIDLPSGKHYKIYVALATSKNLVLGSNKHEPITNFYVNLLLDGSSGVVGRNFPSHLVYLSRRRGCFSLE